VRDISQTLFSTLADTRSGVKKRGLFGLIVVTIKVCASASARLPSGAATNRLTRTVRPANFYLHCAYPKNAFALGREEHLLKMCAEHSTFPFGS